MVCLTQTGAFRQVPEVFLDFESNTLVTFVEIDSLVTLVAKMSRPRTTVYTSIIVQHVVLNLFTIKKVFHILCLP